MQSDVADLLIQWSEGQPEALEELAPLVYSELHRIARARMARERDGHSLQPTALTHEAFLRLRDQNRVRWQGETHFYALASEMMRRILVEHARKRSAAKRGGTDEPITLNEAHGATQQTDVEVLDLHDALNRLEAMDARQARVVELRYFGGLSIEETAELLKVSQATVKRDWDTARRWLYAQLRG